jgi:hypothetical protein
MPSMRHVYPRLATRLLLLTLAGACASGGSRSGAAGAVDQYVRSDTVVVRVANSSDRPLTISLARDADETQLGDVTAGGQARFGVRAALAAKGRIALVARSTRESLRTAPFKAQGGQVVWFRIVPGLAGSQVRVRWPEEGRP